MGDGKEGEGTREGTREDYGGRGEDYGLMLLRYLGIYGRVRAMGW